MGCWHATCGVSRLPIRYGEPVRAFLIVGKRHGLNHAFRDKDWKAGGREWRNGWWSGFTYSEDVFAPRCLPLKATYNDYGSIENIEGGLNAQIVLAQFQTDLMEFPKGEHSIPVEISKNMSLYELIDAIERDAVTVYDYSREATPVGLFLVHEAVYQALINTKYDECDLAYFQKQAYKQVDQIEEYVSLIEKGTVDDRVKAFAQDVYATTDCFGFLPSIFFYKHWLRAKATADETFLDSGEFKTLVQDMAEFAKFSHEMSCARIAWMPQCGKGSQDDNTHGHKAIAEAVLAYHEKLLKEYEDEEV